MIKADVLVRHAGPGEGSAAPITITRRARLMDEEGYPYISYIATYINLQVPTCTTD